MRAIDTIRKLLVLAKRGDRAARTKVDALLRKYDLTENDIPSVRPRGRPRVVELAELDKITRWVGVVAPHTTHRTKVDSIYYGQGIHTLQRNGYNPDPERLRRWAWLLRPDDDNVPHGRRSILAQLGRVGERAREIFADRLCELKPRARIAIKLIRAWQDGVAMELAYLMRDGGDEITDEMLDRAIRAACAPKRTQNILARIPLTY